VVSKFREAHAPATAGEEQTSSESKAKVRADRNPVAFLQSRFPMLHVYAWSKDILESVFTHISVQRYRSGRPFNGGNLPLANIGDDAAKICLWEALDDARVPHPRWQMILQSLQTNEVFSRLAQDFGYAEYLEVGHGVVLPTTSKAYADLTEALIGAVHQEENRDVLRSFCRALGVLGDQSIYNLSAT